MSRRRLSDDERVLWKGVTRSIKPLKIAPLKVEPTADPAEAERPATRLAAKPRARPVAAFVPPSPPPKPAVPPLAPLGRKTKQRIARGSRAIDGRLDLHGMTQAEAHDALFGFIRAKQARGGRLVLVITGHGRISGGVLKAAVPRWLAEPDMRPHLLAITPAQQRDGGTAALYVLLRRLPLD